MADASLRAPCMLADRIIDPQSDEPAEQQVILHLLHQLPLGPDRVEDLIRLARISRSGVVEGRPKSV